MKFKKLILFESPFVKKKDLKKLRIGIQYTQMKN